MASASPLSPTFYGHIASTQDALILFEACLNGTITHVARRPHDRERASLIKSGNVFIYEEHSSGIKRWTDGVPWSPSRILGNFLVYRELERPFPPGEKKRAMKRSKRSPGVSKQDQYNMTGNVMSNGYNAVSAATSSFDGQSGNPLSKETERSLIGSLVDSYGFKEDGLVKKTVSVTVGAVSHHLVSYYTVADVMNNKFLTPSKDPRLHHINPRPDLITKQNFRTPIDEIETLDRIDDRSSFPSYQFPRNPYEVTNQSISQRPMSLPTPPVTYGSTSNVYTNYSMNPAPGSYDGLTPSNPNSGFSNPFAAPPTHNIYPTHKTEGYELGYRQQRYNSAIGIGNDPNRSQMPSVTTIQYGRRLSNFEHNPVDTGLSALSADSKMAHEPGFAHHGYYVSPRDAGSNSTQGYGAQRSLPTPGHQTIYDRPQTNYTLDGNSGHGHYITPQQPWTSTGTS